MDTAAGSGSPPHHEPPGVHAVRRESRAGRDLNVGRGIAEITSALIPSDDRPLDPVGPAEHIGGTREVARLNAVPGM